MKTILLPVADDDGAESRMRVAQGLASAFGAHIVCLHVTPLSAYLVSDSFGGLYTMPDIVAAEEARANGLEAACAGKLDGTGMAWSFERSCGDPAQMIVARARLADIILLPRSQPEHERRGTPPLAGDVAVHAGVPVLALGAGAQAIDLGGKVVVAWNGSPEAAASVRRSIAFLQRASAVELLTVNEGLALDYPPEQAAEYLRRHRVAASIRTIDRPEGPPADAIITEAGAAGAAYLVMGAFGHSRAREYLFGGVTRTMLAESPLPLLLAH